MPFGQLVRDARLNAGLTQEALAERSGVSVRAIQALERGRNTPHRDTVQRLAAALGLGAGERARFEAAALPTLRRRAVSTPAPVRPSETRSTNVPLQLTSFVGRAREMADVTALLAGTRLLTLVGTGGVGKTRLALQVARDLLGQYPHGVWLVELARLTGPALLPQAVAAALGLPDDPSRGPMDVLVTALHSRRLLLILDNCEHVLDACARLAATLLQRCPHVQILATSREPLLIAGETLWHVPPLALPEADHQAGPDEPLSEAMRLFVERTIAIQPHFALTPANARTVADICRRLDGIPLALELAAARVRGLGVEQLAARLDERFRLLKGGHRTALPHQQTLRAMVDWSYDLLAEQERRLFERLSVFAGSFTAEAVEAVCGEGVAVDDDVLDLLLRLVDKSLVVVEEGDTACYRLLETLRQYGQERLGERGEARAVRTRHAAYYLRLAEQAEPELFKAAQAAWHDRLDAALDNLRSALGWCLDEAESATAVDTAAAEWGVRLAGALWWFWYVRMHRWEGIAWIERALRQPTAPSPGRARALLGLAHLAWTAGDRTRAEAMFEDGIAVGRVADDGYALVMLLAFFGYHRRGAHGQEHDEAHDAADHAQGTALLRESLALARTSGDPVLVATALLMFAYSADVYSDEERRRGRAAAEESLALATQVGNLFGIAAAHRVLGRIALHEGDPAGARAEFTAELTTFRTLGDRAAIALALSNLGDAARAEGSAARAVTLYEESLAMYWDIDYDQDLMARVLRHLGDLALAQGDTVLAHARYAESLAAAQQATSHGQTAAALEALGRLAAARAQPLRALRLIGAAAGLRERTGLTLRPDEQATLDRALHRAGETLDVAAWDAAWTQGQSMTPEQAISYALAHPGGEGDENKEQVAATPTNLTSW